MIMCKWGTSEEVEVTIPAHLSYNGKDRKKMSKIDKCIAPIVRALNDGGIRTNACCCGHGGEGRIDLYDGRILKIFG